MLIDSDSCKHTEYVNINALKAERGKINFKMSEEDTEKERIMKEREDNLERDRRNRQRENDELIETRYKSISRHLIR